MGCHAFLRIIQTQGLNLGLLHCWQILYRLSHQGSPLATGFETSPPVLEGKQSLNHWTAREVPCSGILTVELPDTSLSLVVDSGSKRSILFSEL